MTDLLADFRPQTPEAFREFFPITRAIDVKWGEMDAFQHVNNTVYFRWFEDVRILVFQAMDILGKDVGPILKSTSCAFKAPVTFPDEIVAGARIPAVDSQGFEMEMGIFSQSLGRIAATGTARIVPYDYQKVAKADLPQPWRQAIRRLGQTE